MSEDFGRFVGIMKALGDETRLKIFTMLAQGELCACNILEEFNITQPTLSYHMKTLCDCGIVNSRKDGVWMKYSINKESLQVVMNLLEGIAAKTIY